MAPPVYVTPEQKELIHMKELRMQQLNAEKKRRLAEQEILDIDAELEKAALRADVKGILGPLDPRLSDRIELLRILNVFLEQRYPVPVILRAQGKTRYPVDKCFRGSGIIRCQD